MAQRKFSLPGINDLSKEQETARSLPLEGQHLIVGGPGTGKSVIALLRAARLARERKEYIFLVYNILLDNASQQLSDVQLISKTWITWFKQIFQQLTGSACPTTPGKPWDIIWDKVLADIGNMGLPEEYEYPFLVIDEGQDMPPQFYEALANLGFENFFVVADQNQQINEDNSSIQDIRNALDIDTDDVIELKHNYRNSHPIARLAKEFYTGDPASNPPELPSEDPFSLVPTLLEYKKKQKNRIIETIMTMASDDPTKLIGIITPKNDVLKKYLKHCVAARKQEKFTKIRISSYAGGATGQYIENMIGNTSCSFEEGGIIIINAQSCKGLEFDTVFIANVHNHYFNNHLKDVKKKLFYVMVARAIDRLIMLKRKGARCPVCQIIPNDPDILEWK